jgi:hypothetical protein
VVDKVGHGVAQIVMRLFSVQLSPRFFLCALRTP